MSINTLATTRPEDQARAKAKLLYEAIQQIAGSGTELDLASGLKAILGRVTRAFELNQRDSLYTAKAQAIAIVTINLGLEYATGSDLTKAVNALTRNPVEAIYAIGEKVSTELRVRVAEVQEAAFIMTHRGDNTPMYFGVTDQATETQLENWITKGLSDHPFLPIGSMTEINVITAVLDRVVRETALAKKIAWSQVLGAETEEARFSAKLFARNRKETCNSQGGVWKPFLLSLIMQAMGQGWERNEKRLAYVDRFAIIEFLDLVNNHFDEINDRAGLAIDRITQVATRNYGNIVRQGYTPSEIEEIFGFAQSCLVELSDQARTFYAEKTDEEILSVEAIDRFWRERLFLSSSIPYDVRIAESGAAWEKAPQMKSLAALTRLTKGFEHWPAEQQAKFFEVVDLNPMLDAIDHPGDQAAALYGLWRTLGPAEKANANAKSTVLRCINWSHRVNLLIALNSNRTDYQLYANALADGALLANWSYKQIKDLQITHLLGPALRNVNVPLTEEQWGEVYDAASLNSAQAVEMVWSAMDENRRARDFMKLRAGEFSVMIAHWTQEAVVGFFEPILVARGQDPEFRKQFRHWYNGGDRNHGQFLMQGSKWAEQFAALIRTHLDWKTNEEERTEALPVGHRDRRLLDRKIHQETITKIETDQPWKRLVEIDSWDQLCEVFHNFVLWPDEEQDHFLFSVYRVDSLLNAIGTVGEQAKAVNRLWQTMEEPFAESNIVNGALAKAITWTDRSDLVIELIGSGKHRRGVLTLAEKVSWPVAFNKQLLDDEELLKVALGHMSVPTDDQQWETLCQVSSDHGLWAVERIWRMMNGEQQRQLFMLFTASQLSGLFCTHTAAGVCSFFEPILTERGQDEQFRASFKTWYRGNAQKKTGFNASDSWKPSLEELFSRYLDWTMAAGSKINPPVIDDRTEQLVAGENLETMLDQIIGVKAQAQALTGLARVMGGKRNRDAIRRAFELINWTKRAELIVALNGAELEFDPDLLCELANRAEWTYTLARTLRKSKSNVSHYHELMLIAIQLANPPLTPEDWSHVVEKVGFYNPEFGARLWKLMSDADHVRLLTKLPGNLISSIYQDQPWEVVRDFFTLVLTRPERPNNFVKTFENWFYGGKSDFEKAHAFKPAPAWTAELDQLFCELLYGEKPKG